MEEAGGIIIHHHWRGLQKPLRQTKEKSAQTQVYKTLINLLCNDTAKIVSLLGQPTMHICARANG